MATPSFAGAPLLHWTRAGAVVCLAIDNPPVNAINAAVRAAIGNALDRIEMDAGVSGVVITARGTLFSGGGDLREMGRPEPDNAPTMTALARRIENFAKPVVAALRGKAIGGGVLLALACHARLGAPDASIALPEVRLGFTPGAGGTQRLPRLVGIAAALEMIVLAQPLCADAALRHGFFDRLVDADADLTQAAAVHAQAIAQGTLAWRRTALLEVPALQSGDHATQLRSALLARAAQEFPRREAPRVALDLVFGAGRYAFEEGMHQERAAFERLSGGRQSRSLLHLFFAERAAAKAGDPAPHADPAGSVRAVRSGAARVVELVCTGNVAAVDLAAARAQARGERLLPVLVRRESVARRLSSAYHDSAARLAAEGVARAAISAAAAAEGLPAPFAEPGVRCSFAGLDDAVRLTLLQSFVRAAQACMHEGLAQCPGDVDLIAVECCGFPALRGGPLFYANTPQESPR